MTVKTVGWFNNLPGYVTSQNLSHYSLISTKKVMCKICLTSKIECARQYWKFSSLIYLLFFSFDNFYVKLFYCTSHLQQKGLYTKFVLLQNWKCFGILKFFVIFPLFFNFDNFYTRFNPTDRLGRELKRRWAITAQTWGKRKKNYFENFQFSWKGFADNRNFAILSVVKKFGKNCGTVPNYNLGGGCFLLRYVPDVHLQSM